MLLSVTDFRLNSAWSMRGAYVAAMRLRRAWPELEGAVGMWLWAQPHRRRSGAVSVWQSAEDLTRFVRWPVHVATMHKYRKKGEIASISWQAERFDPERAWREAVGYLSHGETPARAAPRPRGVR